MKKEEQPKKVTRTPVQITEEEDEEAHLNSTQNPSIDDKLISLISAIGETETDNRPQTKPKVLFSFIDEDNGEIISLVSTVDTPEDEHWINAKITKATEIQTEINLKKEKNLSLEEQVPKEFHEYLDVFSEEKATRFPEPKKWDHKIELKDTFTPRSFKTYNLTPEETQELDKFLKDNLDKGYIRPSQSPMASPFFFISKKDGKLRPCQDYRYINEHTIKNAYPLPLISELLDKLKGARRFTKLDIRWGYNNVRIRDGDQWKAAFKTNKGLFEPTVMFFGLCNSPATFQSMMDDIFADMIDANEMIDYMDDIFIFAPDETTLTENTTKVSS